MNNENYPQLVPQPDMVSVYNDTQLGQELIKVRSKISEKLIQVQARDESNNLLFDKAGRPIMVWIPANTKYKEILTEDLSTSFLNSEDAALATLHQQVLVQIKAFSESYGIDLTNSYNMVADTHNSLVITSKGIEGRGARISKSQFVESKSTSEQRTFDGNQDKRKKLFGLFPV